MKMTVKHTVKGAATFEDLAVKACIRVVHMFQLGHTTVSASNWFATNVRQAFGATTGAWSSGHCSFTDDTIMGGLSYRSPTWERMSYYDFRITPKGWEMWKDGAFIKRGTA